MHECQARVYFFKMAVATGLNITGSQLFSPFRALGYVSNGVPLALQALGSEHFVATVVGRSFHLYNVSITLILLIVNVFATRFAIRY